MHEPQPYGSCCDVFFPLLFFRMNTNFSCRGAYRLPFSWMCVFVFQCSNIYLKRALQEKYEVRSTNNNWYYHPPGINIFNIPFISMRLIQIIIMCIAYCVLFFPFFSHCTHNFTVKFTLWNLPVALVTVFLFPRAENWMIWSTVGKIHIHFLYMLCVYTNRMSHLFIVCRIRLRSMFTRLFIIHVTHFALLINIEFTWCRHWDAEFTQW